MGSQAQSIAQVRIEERPTENQAATRQRQRGGWVRQNVSLLWLCLLAALLLRGYLIIHTRGVVDGDESLVGIQAQHILAGERPTYFYGIPYLGSLEAYLVALVFAVTGSSVWALRIEPTLLSLLIVWLTWRCAKVLAEEAHLPPYGKNVFMFVAALLAAILPLYDSVIELRTFGGYVETFVLMLLLLLSTLCLTRRWRAGASSGELAWRWAGIGLIVGVGLWVDPLIISAILAAALWISGYCVMGLIGAKRRTGSEDAQPVRQVLSRLCLSVAAVPTCVLGLLPAIIWGASHQWLNVSYVLNLGKSAVPMEIQREYPTRLALMKGLFHVYRTCVAPHIIGGALPFEDSGQLTLLHSFILDVGVGSILVTVIMGGLSFVFRSPRLVQVRRLGALPLLFAACTAVMFCGTTAAAVSGLNSVCSRDLAGRYATPLLLVLPILIATAFTVVALFCYERKRNVRQASGEIGQRQRMSIFSFNARSAEVTQGLLFAFLLMYLGAQVFTYRLADAGYTFQSPYCLDAPIDDGPIIGYLQREHIAYAWAINFLAYPIVFKTHGRILMSDPRPVVRNIAYLNRFPANVEVLRRAERPSMLLIVKRGERQSALLDYLDGQGISYITAYFPAEPNTEVMIVTPLNRTVSPFAVSFPIDLFICYK